jgi:hypothetical protein
MYHEEKLPEAMPLSALAPRVELPRVALRRASDGTTTAVLGDKPAVAHRNELLDSLKSNEELCIVEFWQEHDGRWRREPFYREELARLYPASFQFKFRGWRIIGGTINGACRGELIACTNKSVAIRVVEGWSTLDGLNRVKTMSRLWQPSTQGEPFKLRMLVVDDPLHDGDGILGQSGLETLRQAFNQPHSSVFKLISRWVKVVLRRVQLRWDALPAGVEHQDGRLSFEGQAIDGIMYRDNLKLFKDRFPSGSIAEFTEKDIRLHATEGHTSFHRAGIGRQLLQYLPAELGARLLAASDIPLVASHWSKALTGDLASLRYLLGLTQDENADEHEIRSQLIRHLEAGCPDVSIPYLRQRVLPILAGIFRNRIRKGRCPGAWIYAAPSTRLGRYEVAVPARMLSHEERDAIKRGEAVQLLATRYPITGPASINAMKAVAFHSGAVCYIHPDTWRDSFQGDFDGDCITLLRVSPEGWENSNPWIPPAVEKPRAITTPRALEQAALSKRDVAIGETVIAEYVQRCWEERGKLAPDELNELGTRVICSAVDRAKHGQVAWGISPEEFVREYLPRDDSKCSLRLAMAKELEDDAPAEQELKSRLRLLKLSDFQVNRSGLEMQLHLIQGWLDGVELMAVGSHEPLYRRVLELQAELSPPDARVFAWVKRARFAWAKAVDCWKQTGDDTAMRTFGERFQGWLARLNEATASSVVLELGKQLLRPRKHGNASLFWSQVPALVLRQVYGE